VYTLVVAVYLLLSSGLVLQLHYCMDRLAAIGVFNSDHRDVCKDCGMSMNDDNDCCHDRTDVIKLVQDQTKAPAQVTLIKPVIAAPLPDWMMIGEDLHVRLAIHLVHSSDLLFEKERYRYRLLEVFRI